MTLVNDAAQTISLADVSLANERRHFSVEEAWITEHSVKYSPAATADQAQQAGWRIQLCWHDANDHVSLHLLVPAD